MGSLLATLPHPSQLQDLPLASIGAAVVAVSTVTLFILLEVLSNMGTGIGEAGIMDAEIVRVEDLFPDIFEMEDVDIPPEFLE